MFSQNDEERVILELLRGRPPGRFLDLGAYDGKTFSNTHQLALDSWSGVCVEPCFQSFRLLSELHRENPRIALVNALIGSEWRLVPFWSSADAVATADPQHHAKWQAAAQFQRIWVAEVPVAELLRAHPGPYDVISVDCEGAATEQIFRDLSVADRGDPAGGNRSSAPRSSAWNTKPPTRTPWCVTRTSAGCVSCTRRART